MNQLTKVFEGHNIRIVAENGEELFMLLDVCEALDLKNPSEVAKRVREKYKHKISLGLQGRSPIFINEPGLYQVVMRADQSDKAERFQDWVYEEVLPSLRKTGSYEMPKPQLPQQVVETMPKLFRGVADLIDWKEVAVAALDEVQMDINELKNGLTLTHGQQLAIQEAKRRRVRDMFDRYGDDHPFLDTKAKFHSRCGSDLKKAFNVPRYGEILRKDFEEAMQYVQAWRPPFQ